MTTHLMAAANILMRVLALMVTRAGISREKQARALPFSKCVMSLAHPPSPHHRRAGWSRRGHLRGAWHLWALSCHEHHTHSPHAVVSAQPSPEDIFFLTQPHPFGGHHGLFSLLFLHPLSGPPTLLARNSFQGLMQESSHTGSFISAC